MAKLTIERRCSGFTPTTSKRLKTVNVERSNLPCDICLDEESEKVAKVTIPVDTGTRIYYLCDSCMEKITNFLWEY